MWPFSKKEIKKEIKEEIKVSRELPHRAPSFP